MQTRLVLQEGSLAKPSVGRMFSQHGEAHAPGQNLAQLTFLLVNAFDQARGTERHLNQKKESCFSSPSLGLKSRVMIGDGSPWAHMQSSYLLLLQLISRDFMAM